MTDEKQIDEALEWCAGRDRAKRLEKLAGEAWPLIPGIGIYCDGDMEDPEYFVRGAIAGDPISIRHPNALDALEAALLVLNGPEALREFAYAVVEREGIVEKAVAAERERVCAILEDAWGEDTGGPCPSNFSEAIDKLRSGA